ncbi:MAG: twin-arginine translocase TatA/TatE family subunit [Pseudomonadota bacterium]
MGPNWQTFVILFILIVVLFGGRGRISALMGDMAKGIKSFKKGMAEEDDDPSASKPTASLSEAPKSADTPVQTPTDTSKTS